MAAIHGHVSDDFLMMTGKCSEDATKPPAKRLFNRLLDTAPTLHLERLWRSGDGSKHEVAW